MNIQEIQKLAHEFRQATDEAFEYGALGPDYPFNNFPHECCDDMCDLFGQLLFEKEVPIYKVHGIYRYDNWDHQYPHVWLTLEDGTIIDLTGDQYKDDPIMLNYNIPCYIGKENSLYKFFPKKERKSYPYYGIDNYGDEKTRKRLWKLYDIILGFYRGN